MKWAGQIARLRVRRNAYRILVGKPEETLGRPRRKWENNIKMNPRGTGSDVMD
jgi:hypothetical protein